MKIFRYFSIFPEPYERFLNAMAKKGWRLQKVGFFFFYFVPSLPGEVSYQVLFIGEQSHKKSQHMRQYLQESDCRVFTKNGYLLPFLGVQWRPYGKKWGQISSFPGNYYKELLIIERERASFFCEFFTSSADKAEYYNILQRVSIYRTLMLVVFLLFAGMEMFLWQSPFHSGVTEIYNSNSSITLVSGWRSFSTLSGSLFLGSLFILILGFFGFLLCVYHYHKKMEYYNKLRLVEE